MTKKLFTGVCLSMMLAATLAGCGEQESTKEETTTTAVAQEKETEFESKDISAAGWKIVVENVMVNKELSDVSVLLGYESAQTNKVNFTATEGNKYVCIKLLLEKESSTENIVWDKMYIQDTEGNQYHRIEDGFLEELNMNRMPGTTLNFGSNEGWIVFMIPDETENVSLMYEFEDDIVRYELNAAMK